MSNQKYVHGYSGREQARLLDQANTLADLLHTGTAYPPGSTVLEAGCGVGAQTVILARQSPEARITSIDISPVSLEQARQAVERAGFTNVRFQVYDICCNQSAIFRWSANGLFAKRNVPPLIDDNRTF